MKQNVMIKFPEKMFNATSAVVIVFNVSCHIIWINKAFEQSFGYDLSDLEKSNKWPFLTAPHQKKFSSVLKKALSGTPQETFDIPIIHADTTIKTVRWSTMLLHDRSSQEAVAVLGVIINSMSDVAERRRMEDELYRTEDKYRTVLEDMDEGYFEVDLDGNFTFVNDAECRDLGYSRKELIGMNYRQYSDEATADKLYKLFTSIFKTGHTVKGYPGQFISKDGRRHFNEVSASLILNAKGKPFGFRGISRDITERKDTERLLQENEAQLRAITNNIPGSVFQFYAKDNGEYGMHFISERINEFLKLPSKMDAMFSAFVSHVYEEDRDRFLASIRDAVRSVSAWNFEGRFLNASGKLMWFHGQAMPTRHEDRLVFDGILLDITERKQAEKALRESEELYHSLFDNMLNAFQYCKMVFDQGAPADFIYLNVNKAFQSLTGFDHVIGKKVSEILPDIKQTDPGLLNVLGRVALTGNPEKFEGYLNSLKRWLSVSIYSPQKEYFVALFEDITERKRVEEALKEERIFTDAVLDSVPGMLYLYDEEGYLRRWNKSHETMTGYTNEELDGMHILDWFKHDEKGAATIKAAVEKAFREGHSNAEGKLMIKSGETMPYYFTATLLEIKGKKYMTGIGINMTDRKRGEYERQKLQEQLLEAQKLESIGRLAGGVAHDFNNILAGIQGNTSLMMMEHNPEHPHYSRLKRIEEHVRRGANLTRQLLSFARGGKSELKTLSINDAVRKMAHIFVETHKEIEVDFQLQDSLHPVEADAGQIEQVLLNIFINAAHAMSKGGYLHIQTCNVNLQRADTRTFEVEPGKYVKISISDTGCGMDSETIKQIFEPFFTTRGHEGGFGLGLASAYGIIRNHGGIINAYSEPGHGSTFSIYLPSSEKKIERENQESEINLISGSGGLLLVDDEPMILATTSEMLRILGYTVYPAASGQEAVSIYMEKMDRIDLVILDMILPGMKGSQVLKMLQDVNPGVKVLLSSGYIMQGEVQKVMESGCCGFIQKPYLYSELSSIVHQILGPSQA